MKRNLLAPFLEEAADRYHAEGYAYKYAQGALGCAASFGEWLQTRRVPLDQISEEHIDGFLHWFVPRPPEKSTHKRKRTLAAIRAVLALIQARYPMALAPSPVQAEVGRYVDHLRRNRGLAECTLELHQRHLERFLTFCFRQGSVDYSAITAARIYAYVDDLPHSICNSRRRCTCIALRGYFRFLQLQGVATGHLQAVVPTVRRPRTALSPKWLTSVDVDRLLRFIDRSRTTGKRDYAAILCMTDLGLRVGDVARLSLDDIDWGEGTVRVPNHKRGRPYRLPLPRRLGQALADYLANGRPSSQRREVFLCHAHPRGSSVTAGALKRAVQRAWQRSGLDKRLDALRSFARYLAAFEPRTEIPPAGLFGPSFKRVPPHIYTPQEIAALIRESLTYQPSLRRNPLTGLRNATVIGLLACTGMRIGEVLALNNGDVDLDQGLIIVRESKNLPMRLVPITDCAGDHLRRYREARDQRFGRSGDSDAFIRSPRGGHLGYGTMMWAFKQLRERIGLKNGSGRNPCLHDLRHTFACNHLLRAYRENRNIDNAVHELSIYLGHANLASTYWYLSGVPALLEQCTKRSEAQGLRSRNGGPS